MTLTPRQWLLLALAATLVFAGWHYRDLLQDKKDLDVVQDELGHRDVVDQVVAEKISTEAKIDRGASRALDRNRESARHAPEYQDYLDRPLPAESLRLYRDAYEAIEAAGADGGGAADDEDAD